ncbi:hypothetical protein FNV43_RR17128 [Rhamnella rubrinervis]|uniref:SCP domain-containing protein n=1 Tax=Rhamnella rubrinervis TaxID=2594499 RepID=A0A8K0GVH6_9ROSA|nr:hypothetical protein FNV43_RR17128 [Rhamnella rubrinervis]
MGPARGLLVLLVALTMCMINSVQSAATPSPSAAAREFVEAHNQARAAVGVDPLKWSETLANATSRVVRYQRNKMGCQFADLKGSKYGANQFWGGGATTWTPRMVVDEWVGSKKYYNYANNSCLPNQKCGTYTQVVWRKSTELGCAQATCLKETATVLVICFYNPPGNYIGERPY